MLKIKIMYRELEKYKTGRTVKTIGVLPNKNEVPIPMDEYVFPVGDLITDLVKLKRLPFWKRKYHHKHLIEIYTSVLNEVKINKPF